jgi:DNA (cytosine-5)-methyltransferase 1
VKLRDAAVDSRDRGVPAQLVLSLFPGADLFGLGFERAGFCVVRGPDLLWGQDVRSFTPARHRFDGLIGGPPCQNFSRANFRRDAAAGTELLDQFRRCVTEAAPLWFLMENVGGSPSIAVPGYVTQRIALNAREVGMAQNRMRWFTFGSGDGKPLALARCDPGTGTAPATLQPGASPGRSPARCALASEAYRPDRRGWPDFCELQGLPRTFTLPGLSRGAAYRLVGNGVPVPVAEMLARSVLAWMTEPARDVCACGCGRPVTGRRTLVTEACKKRAQRARLAAGATSRG